MRSISKRLPTPRAPRRCVVAAVSVVAAALLAARPAVAAVGIDVDFDLGVVDNAIVLNDVVHASDLYAPKTFAPTFGGVTLSIPFNNDYGQGSVLAVVDLGLADNANPALTRVSTYVNINLPTNPATTPPATLIGDHANSVTKFAGGFNGTTTDNFVSLTDFGVAPAATLWSGSIVETGNPNDDTNTQTTASVMYPFVQMMEVGINGRKADVLNASFGAPDVPPSDDFLSAALDGLARQNPHSTLAIAAGNSGPGNGTVASPAAGFNNISVAALASDPTLSYTSASEYSSRGPQGFYNPYNNQTVPSARPAVDLAAPGDYFITEATPVASEPGNYLLSIGAGTSFATPLVSGAVAQLTAYAHGLENSSGTLSSLDPKFPQRVQDATDSRVVKAILLNSADKTGVWNNGQTLVNGVLTTSQGLDPVIGAGRLNVGRAADNYLNGAFDPGVIGTAFVGPRGWDLSTVTEGVPNVYLLGQLEAGQTLTTTLDWFAEDSYDSATMLASADRFANLYLEVFELNGADPPQMIALSGTPYNNVQELSFLLHATADYEIAVVYAGVQYAPIGDLTNSEQYALAWSNVSVPEPSGVLMAFSMMTIVARRRRPVLA